MKTKEDEAEARMEFNRQVVDVSDALLSVHQVCEQGHDVLFTKRPDGSAILVGGFFNARIPIRHSRGTYELDVWVKPAKAFAGRGGKTESRRKTQWTPEWP